VVVPRVTSASSLTGFQVEIFFSEEMRDNAAFLDPANYTLTGITGAPATALSITPGTAGSFGGYTSVIVTHTGTTLGGSYTLTVVGIEDMAGNRIDALPTNTATLLTLGEAADFVVTPLSGTSLSVQFYVPGTTTAQEMLPESGFSPGIQDSSGYEVQTPYPVPLTLQSITHPVGGDASQVLLTVQGQTSADYTLVISPAEAISYDGTILPSASTAFTGVELGVGASSAGASGLLLSKAAGDFYGWAWEDLSGRILPASSYRMDFTLEVPSGAYAVAPPLSTNPFAALFISDGAVQVALTLTRSGLTDVVDIDSGAFTASVPADWSNGVGVISLLRNQKAGIYTVLFDGVPLISGPIASFTGVPTIAPGVACILGTAYEVNGFRVPGVSFSSSQTIFTNSWNFLHNGTSVFVGSAALTRDHLLTERGPLVKGWGDATPATEQDVEVLVNGTAVGVSAVNPYLGRIETTLPIPLLPAGSMTVEVNYTWFPSPPMEMTGLNTLGLNLNKWDLKRGHHFPPSSPLPADSVGVADTARFPLGIVLPPLTRQHPILIGHRYIGFEKAYTAGLNSPTTLLLNQNPHRVSVPYLEKTPEGVSVAYEGDVAPVLAQPAWELVGTDTGFPVGDGTYTLIDATSGSFGGQAAALYTRDEDLSFPLSLVLAGRLQVGSYTADGVFTGVGLGAHDNRRLYLAGCLEINGVKHVGLLQDAAQPHLADSWDLGPQVAITITSSKAFTAPSANLPNIVEQGARFQILSGSQAGIYEIDTITPLADGTTALTVTASSVFPADPGLWGNDTATVVFEVPWDQALSTYRLVVNPDADQGFAQLFVGGSLAGLVLTVDNVRASPADTALLLSTAGPGQIFWGSSSRPAINQSTWSFLRYGVTSDQTTLSARGVVVAAEMSDKPENDPNNEWFITNEFGYSEVDSSGDTLLLKSTSQWATTAIDLTFGYARIEPLLTTRQHIDLDATFRVDSGTLGSGDAQIALFDTGRVVRMGTLLYAEGGTPYRRLVNLAAVSLSGLFEPTAQGWAAPGSTLTTTVRGQILTLQQAAGQAGTFTGTLVHNDDSSGGRIIEARIAITSHTAGVAGNAGPAFGAQIGGGAVAGTTRTVMLRFYDSGTPTVVLADENGAPVASYAFDWADQAFHTYRIIGDPTTTTVELVIDDSSVGVVDLTLFASGGTSTGQFAYLGALGTAAASVTEVDSFSVQVLPLPTVKRTLGLFRGGDVDDIDNWEIPRSDTTDSLNSLSGAVAIEMDWRSDIKVRLQVDPTWGVTLLRPDLPLPPWYDGDFATEVVQPSAGWINVDYRDLPRSPKSLGQVEWGALDSRSVTQQRWGEVRYRIYSQPTEDYLSPQNMVLNRYNVISSGELARDVTVEVVEVESITSTLVSLRPAHMTADRVFVVQVDGAVVPSSEWAFDPTTQTIALSTALPTAHHMVTVTFAPGNPVTNTYLCSQPLLDGVTLLNDTTPPYPKSQVIDTIREIVFGSKINDPNDTLNTDADFILNDPARSVEFQNDPSSLYENIEFCEVDDGGDTGILSTICDGPVPGLGLVGLALEGSLFTDCFTVPGGPGGTFGGGSPVIGGSASSFSQTSILHASGGHYVDGVLGPGTAVLFPNYPSGPDIIPGTGAGGNQEIKLQLDYTFPVDTWGFPTVLGDNTPPTYADPVVDPNPDATPGTQNHGACAAEIVDYAATGTSRLGPWGGMTSLQTNSILAGGAPLDGTEFTLGGGVALPEPTTTTMQLEAAN
jgi:hypothetical protein